MRRLTAVSKRYGRGTVLDGVDLRVEPGDVVAIVGGNGSGKSTLTRIVAGLSRPSAGTVTGTPTIGYLPDRFPGGRRFGPLDYLAHVGRIGGLPTATARARARDWLDRLAFVDRAGVPHTAPTTDSELSKGNLQKVGLVQALLTEPELVVLDEPFSGLDSGAHDVLGDIIGELGDGGSAVVFTEHGASQARAHAARVHSLDRGRLTSDAGGDVRIVLRHPPGAAATTDDTPPAGEGIVAAEHVDGRLELSVHADAADTVLRDALADGWSVLDVSR